MSTGATLLVELLTEELPPKALQRLSEALSTSVADGLRKLNFLAPESAVTTFATPRRLATSLTRVTHDVTMPARAIPLLPVNVAYSAEGQPTEALDKAIKSKTGFAQYAEVPPERIERRTDGKLERLYYIEPPVIVTLRSALEETLGDAIAKLPIPKVMSYAAAGSYYNDVKFVRPAHGLVALHGDAVVPVEALHLKSGRATNGHRFLCNAPVVIESADAYADTLRAEGKVIARFAERRQLIRDRLQETAGDATVILPDGLLDEVTGLVEWPVVLEGSFDPAFLTVPQECLVLTMQQNQKYFALADGHGKLVPRFLVVSNLETVDPRAIIEGNERVLRARLADARFFYDQDRKIRLDARVPKLAAIVYHNKLGTQLERVTRLTKLSGTLAPMVGADPTESMRAAHLAKADLTTDMVGEFPELQGLMGRYYALHDGEPAAVAAAIEQHYWPRYAGDALPDGPVAQTVALADKLETLAGLFGIGAQPTGDKDPFGLRRHAIGLIRILIERKLPIRLGDLVDAGFGAFADMPAVADARVDLESFIYERLRAYLRDAAYSANEAEAVLSQRPARIDLVPAQAAAVRAFGSLPESDTLAGANKRIINILRKSGSEAAVAIDRGRLTDGAEHDLYLAFQKLEPIVADRCAAGDFTGALMVLATAKPAVDRFFDDVMVMADDPAVRANRLALLRGVAQTMNRVADISKLAA